MCKISVIVPVFNVESYIERCLNSLIRQTILDYEVLLINDGSTDLSGQICDEYSQKDLRFRVFHQKNSGVSSARNVGIDNARGEWIVFVDPDDYVSKHFLESFHLNDTDSQLSVVCLRYLDSLNLKEFKNVNYVDAHIDVRGDLDGLERSNLLFHTYVACKAYRNGLIRHNKIRFNTSLTFQEDNLFFMEYLSFVKKIDIHSECVYNYIIYPSGTTLSSKIHSWEELSNSSDNLIVALNKISFVEKLSDNYRKSLYNFMLSEKYSACYNLVKYTANNEIKSIKKILYSNDYFAKFYTPLTIREKLLMLCFHCGPFFVYLYFTLLNKISNFIHR